MENVASLDQAKQILSLFAKSNKDQVQQWIANGDLIKVISEIPDLKVIDRDGLRRFLKECKERGRNPFANEFFNSRHKYPAKYHPKNVDDQVRILQVIYKDLGLDASHVEETAKGMKLPKGVELLQVVPKLSAIAKAKGIEDPYGDNYGNCVGIMLSMIGEQRTLHNDREGEMTKKHIRLLASAKNVLMKLELETPGDFIIVPIQSGLLYAGSSVRKARWEIEEDSSQWASPSWVIGHHLLTHPGRLEEHEGLQLNCPGEEYSPVAGGVFCYAPCFFFCDDGVTFDVERIEDAVDGGYGSASGFLLECLNPGA